MIQPYSAEFEEAHRLQVDLKLRHLTRSGKSREAPYRAYRPGAPRAPAPGSQCEVTVKLKAGELRVLATDHSPDGVNPVQAWLGKSLVYEADDYGAVLRTFELGPWVAQMIEKADA